MSRRISVVGICQTGKRQAHEYRAAPGCRLFVCGLLPKEIPMDGFQLRQLAVCRCCDIGITESLAAVTAFFRKIRKTPVMRHDTDCRVHFVLMKQKRRAGICVVDGQMRLISGMQGSLIFFLKLAQIMQRCRVGDSADQCHAVFLFCRKCSRFLRISNSVIMDILYMIQIGLRRKTIVCAVREIFFIHQTLARS